jgi:hypothetical protein
MVGHGRTVSKSELVGEIPKLKEGQTVRLLGPDDVFLAVGTTVDTSPAFRPVVVFPSVDDEPPDGLSLSSSSALHDRDRMV